MNNLLGSQVLSLPEDILKKKWAGDLEGAMRAIDARLEKALPRLLRERLIVERELLKRLPREYPFTREQALREITLRVPDFTEREFDRIEAEGGIDFLFVGGEKRYFHSVYPMLLEWDRRYIARSGKPVSADRPILDEAIAELKREGQLAYRIQIRAQLSIEDGAFVPGETYRVHLPVPKPCAQQSNIRITPEPDGLVSPEHSAQRTVFYERTLAENRPFVVSYQYDSRVRYVDLMNRPEVSGPVYPGAEPPSEADLSEIWPHLVFSPYLRDLAREVRGDKTDPIDVARACYDFVTRNVTYSYLRDYLLVDNVAEGVALNLKGDCGAQSLLFMALCRLSGIPARWQSGTTARTDGVSSHDWAQFYVEPYGWLLCDCSFGGGAYRAGSEQRWHFYFGNLDPFRMVANSAYMAEFDPPKAFLRFDPYDNQSGECETLARGLGGTEHKTERTLVSITKL